MAKGTKVMSSKASVSFPKGGKTGMFGKQHAGPQKAGQTNTGSKAGSGGKFPMGGKTGMFGKQHAGAARGGTTGKC